MALTFEVNKDKSVTIYNDKTVFAHQFDDPDVEGYDVFESKARAEEWAKEAIKQYTLDEEREANLKHALGAYEKEKETLALGLKSVGENNVIVEDTVEETPTKK